jgi:DNA-binding SARP family transcriptional activator/tetratricopeptide (TPR) repeat protein
VRFALLGPLRFGEDGEGADELREIVGAMPRTLLAMLLLNANTVVSVDRLIDALWQGSPPASAQGSLHNHVMRLRRMLGPDGAARLRAVAPGYLIRVEPGELDADAFAERYAAGAALVRAGQWTEAARQLGLALALWRGEPGSDVPGLDAQDARIQQLLEWRMQAVEGRIDAELELGRHAELVGELRTLVANHPLREAFHRQLMLALFRADRQAEALDVYRDLRRTLVSELGVEPSPSVRSLHQRILCREPSLAAPVGEPPPVPDDVRRARGPAQLPQDIADFTGRDDEVAGLAGAVDSHAADVPWVTVIDGMAGVGKTAFATHLAHRLAGSYPDGQLYVNLHGHTPGLAPAEPADVLRTLLASLGVPEKRIPDGVDARAALWRSELSDRRTIILLDDAAGIDQVRPLLPGTSGNLVFVTSRTRLQLDSAHTITLGVLSEADAAGLFQRIVGTRSQAEPAEVADVVRLCGLLPLAIRIAGARLCSRPAWTVAHLVARLADQDDRLAELAVADRSVAASFTLSYQQLTADQQRLFRLLGLHPGADFDAHAAAALDGVAPRAAERVLERLLDAHLLEQHIAGRYTFHDLLRQHARHRALEEDDDTGRAEAMTRLFDFYRSVAAEAVDLVMPLPPQRRPKIEPPSIVPAPFTRPHEADAWLEAERANLLAVAALTASGDWSAYACDLSDLLGPYLNSHGRLEDAAFLHTHAVQTARRHGDPVREGSALRGLGNAYQMLSRYADARATYLESLAVCRSIGDEVGEARSLNNLGCVAWRVGELTQAVEHLQQALVAYRAAGDYGETVALNNLGGTCLRLGRYQESADYFGQALANHTAAGRPAGRCDALIGLGTIFGRTGRIDDALAHLEDALATAREHGLVIAESGVLESLAVIYSKQGRYDEAVDHFQRCLSVCRDVGNESGAALAITGLGVAHARMGESGQALVHFEQALTLCRNIGDRLAHASVLNGIAGTLLSIGEPEQAVDHYASALDLARATGDRHEQARALYGLSRAYHDLGKQDSAGEYGGQAAELFDELGEAAFFL